MIRGSCILTDGTIMIIGRHCIILAVLCHIRLQPVLEHLKIAVIIMGLDDMGFLIKTDEIPLHQLFRRHFRIIEVLR